MLSIFRTPEAAKSLRDLPRRCPSSLPVRMISHLIIAAHQLRGCGPGRTDFRRGGNDSRAGPGSFLARLLPVEDGNVQALARQLQRDRAANHSAAGDGYVEWFAGFGVRVCGTHAAILAHPAAGFRVRPPPFRERLLLSIPRIFAGGASRLAIPE